MTIKSSASAPLYCSDWDTLVVDFLNYGRNRYSCSFVVYTDGTYYYGEDGTTGTLDYGGSLNAGGISGTNFAAVVNACHDDLTSGGKICIKEGTYNTTEEITITNDNVHLSGSGHGTLIQKANGAGDFTMIFVDGAIGALVDGVIVSDLKLDGNRTNQTNAVNWWGIRGEYVTNYTVRGCSVNSTYRSGIRVEDCERVKIHDNFVYDTRIGIMVDHFSYDVTVTGNVVRAPYGTHGIATYNSSQRITIDGNVCTNATSNGIDIGASDYVAVSDNTTYSSGGLGLAIDDVGAEGATNVTVEGHVSIDDADIGILIDQLSQHCSISDSVIVNAGAEGIYIQGDHNSVKGCLIDTSIAHGVRVNSDHNIISDNIIMDIASAGDEGFYIEGDWNKVHNNYSFNNGRDGFRVSGDNNDIRDNHAVDNTGTGINIVAGATSNVVFGNRMDNNTAAVFVDAGTTTILPTHELQFVDGTTFLSAAGPWGWEIDLATEYAIAIGHLPEHVQAVVRWKIWATSIVTEADAMRLEIVGRGGASNQPFTTESVDVANHPSTTTNFTANDIIYWIVDATDDGDIDDFVGGDAIMIKVLHEAAGGGDAATDAAFLSVEIEYV